MIRGDRLRLWAIALMVVAAVELVLALFVHRGWYLFLALPLGVVALFAVAIGLSRMSLRAATREATDTEFVTDKHASELDAMLLAALTAVESGNARSEDDPLVREMFALHFAELDETLRQWDQTNLRWMGVSGYLERRFFLALREQGLDENLYAVWVVAREFAEITGRRSLTGTLETPLPAAFGTPESIWRAWPTAHPMGGTITFRNEGRGQGPAIHVPFEDLSDDEFAAEFEARLPDLVAPIYGLLQEAQHWDDAREPRLAREALRSFPQDDLCLAIKKMRLKPRFPVVAGCPGCE